MSLVIEQSIEDKLATLPRDKRVSVKQFMRKYNIDYEHALRLREVNDEMKEMRLDNPKKYSSLDEYQRLLEECRNIRNMNRDSQEKTTVQKGRMNVEQLMKRYNITEAAATELHDNISRRDVLMAEVNQLLERAKELRMSNKNESKNESSDESSDDLSE